MVTSGNAAPLTTTIPGNLGNFDLRLNIRSGLKYISPLVLFSGKGGSYDGNLSPATKSVTLKSMAVSTPNFRWHEFDAQKTRTGTFTGSYTDTATTLTVNSTAALGVNCIIKNGITEENMLISQIISSTQIKVVRAFGSVVADNTVTPAGLTRDTAAASDGSSDPWIYVTVAMEQGSTNHDSIFNSPTIREGATQILRKDISIDGTTLAQEKTTLTKDTMYKARQEQALLEAFVDLEYAAFFGKMIRSSNYGAIGAVTFNGKNITASDGIFNTINQYASGNVISATALGAAGNTITVAKLDQISFKLSQRPGNHVIFVGEKIKREIQYLATLASGGFRLNVESGSKGTDFNAKVNNYIGSFGNLSFNYHPLMDLTPKLEATMLAVNTDCLYLVHLDGRAISWHDNAEDPAFDGVAGYYLGEHGIVVSHAKEHFIFNEFTDLVTS